MNQRFANSIRFNYKISTVSTARLFSRLFFVAFATPCHHLLHVVSSRRVRVTLFFLAENCARHCFRPSTHGNVIVRILVSEKRRWTRARVQIKVLHDLRSFVHAFIRLLSRLINADSNARSLSVSLSFSLIRILTSDSRHWEKTLNTANESVRTN